MVVQIVSGLIALIVALLLIIPSIRYRVTSRWLLISILGLPVRWVSLRNIRYITDHAKEFAESWPNTFSPHTRLLYIRKRRGFIRTLKITPQKRFVFKAELEKAIRAVDPDAEFDDTKFYERKPVTGALKHREAGL